MKAPLPGDVLVNGEPVIGDLDWVTMYLPQIARDLASNPVETGFRGTGWIPLPVQLGNTVLSGLLSRLAGAALSGTNEPSLIAANVSKSQHYLLHEVHASPGSLGTPLRNWAPEGEPLRRTGVGRRSLTGPASALRETKLGTSGSEPSHPSTSRRSVVARLPKIANGCQFLGPPLVGRLPNRLVGLRQFMQGARRQGTRRGKQARSCSCDGCSVTGRWGHVHTLSDVPPSFIMQPNSAVGMTLRQPFWMERRQ